MSSRRGRLWHANPLGATNHALNHGPRPPVDVPRPQRYTFWDQWRRERACRRDTRHCYHPADVMIGWFCCMCSADTDGMPDQRCVFCKAATIAFEAAAFEAAVNRELMDDYQARMDAYADTLFGRADNDGRSTWPICTPEGEFAGGVWCASEECPCAAENSEIGDFQEKTFTIVDLHAAVAAHIAAQRERKAAT
jgi:hypothetical protein